MLGIVERRMFSGGHRVFEDICFHKGYKIVQLTDLSLGLIKLAKRKGVFTMNFRIGLILHLFGFKVNYLCQGVDELSIIKFAKGSIFKRYTNALLHAAFRHSRVKVLYVSKYLLEHYKKRTLWSCIGILENYVADEFINSVPFKFRKYDVGFIYRLNPNKRSSELNNYLKSVSNNNLNVLVLVAPEVIDEELVVRGENLHIVRADSKKEISDFYNSIKIFISYSLSEGFNLPVREALACGCHVLTTEDGGTNELLGRDFFIQKFEDLERLSLETYLIEVGEGAYTSNVSFVNKKEWVKKLKEITL